MSINLRIKAARQAAGMTQQELADALGVAKTTISGYERGSNEPNSQRIHALAHILNVSGDYLIGLTDEPVSPAAATPSLPALDLARKYDRLDAHGRYLVALVVDAELDRMNGA